MINQNNQSAFIKRITLFLSMGSLALLLGCSPSNIPGPNNPISNAPQITPAAPVQQAPAVEVDLVESTEVNNLEVVNPDPVAQTDEGSVLLSSPNPNQQSTVNVAASAGPNSPEASAALIQSISEPLQLADGRLQLEWGDLVPADFTSDAIYNKYQEQLAELQPGDPKAFEIQAQMQDELNNAPTNEDLNGKLVRVPGFITPLDYAESSIQEFLLVPYYGACIHVPPPPVNQTVFVTTADGDEIAMEDAFGPIWVTGVLQTESTDTNLATAGYTIVDAKIELYSYDE